MSDMSSVWGEISSLRSEIYSLKREIDEMRATLESYLSRLVEISRSMDGKLSDINRSLERNRMDVAVRLIYLKAMFLAMEYMESNAKLKSLREYLDYIEDKLKETSKNFKEHYVEIMEAYLQTVDNVFDQFVKVSQNEFRLLDMTLSMMEDVKAMYELLEPEYVDEDLLRLAVETDIAKRIESLEKIKKALSEASTKLSEASTTYERVHGQLLEYAFASRSFKDEKIIVFLPVTRIKVSFKDGGEESITDTFGPRFEYNLPLSIEEKLLDYVGDRVEDFPLDIDLGKVREKLRVLEREARDEDEKRLIRRMIEGVR